MRAILAYLTVEPGKEAEFRDKMTAQAKRCLANEPGCLQFDVVQDPGNATRFVMLEVCKDDAAIAAHSTASTSRISGQWSATWSPSAGSRSSTWYRTATASAPSAAHRA
jgi:(4S)-4-hydroxy-5-phosphonooxypentane-2,3-dione isomerase